MGYSLLFKILMVFGIFSIGSCTGDDIQKVSESEYQLKSKNKSSAVDEFPGKIPSDLDIYKIVQFPGNHTWKDVDEYYKNELPKHKNTPYYANLEDMLFYHLIEQFKMDELAALDVILFYIERQNEHGVLAEPDLYVRCLKRMEKSGHWKYLLPYANNKFNKDRMLMEKNPELAGYKLKYQNSLGQYINELNQKFGVHK